MHDCDDGHDDNIHHDDEDDDDDDAGESPHIPT